MLTSIKNNCSLKIAVLSGGIGDERQISLQSGKSIADALKNAGLNVQMCDITPQKLDILEDKTIDVFFLALHGCFGEDGQLQKILEQKQLCFTASGSRASRLAFDKIETKKVFDRRNINTARWVIFDHNNEHIGEKLRLMGNKFVVKPAKQGSSVGITIAESVEEAIGQAEECAVSFGPCLIEEFIDGRELTVGILDGSPLPIIEIIPENGFYDFEAKYIDDKTQYLFDTIDDIELVKKIQDSAVECFDALDCRGFARVDFMLDRANTPFAIEVNTIPGFTTHSLLPKAAEKIGLDMTKLCLSIIENARNADTKLSGNVTS